MSEPKVLLTDLGIPESARWHEGRLWFCNWGRRSRCGRSGRQREVMTTRHPVSHPMGYSIDWLPDGRLLVTGDKLRRREADGSMVGHADLSARTRSWWTAAATSTSTAWTSTRRGSAPRPGLIALVTPDGQPRQVAGDIQFPNGMVVTPDNRTLIIAESFAGRLTAFDIAADGSLSNRRVWAKAPARRHLPRRRGRGLGRHRRLLDRPRRRGGRGPATRRTAREPGPVRADARRTGPANPVHPDRRMAASRRPRRQPRSAGQRASHRRDPDPPGLRTRRRPAMTQVAD